MQVTGLTSGLTAISVGAYTTCAVVSGSAKCWGDNSSSELGNGTTTTSSTTPMQVTGLTSGVTAIAAGGSGACAIVSGSVKCWGDNSYGQLGNGTTTSSTTPVQVTGLTSGVTAISVGAVATCAIVSGSAKCWGYNAFGELGNGTTTNSSTPVQVTGLTSGLTAISVGGSQTTCAVVSGSAECWGANGQGELGNGTTTNHSSTPAQVTGLTSGVTAISVGGSNATCAIVSGSAKCWGYNGYGELGNGTTTNSSTPVQVTGLTSGLTAIAAGGNDSMLAN